MKEKEIISKVRIYDYEELSEADRELIDKAILTNGFGRRSSFCFGSCLGSSLTARRCRCR